MRIWAEYSLPFFDDSNTHSSYTTNGQKMRPFPLRGMATVVPAESPRHFPVPNPA